jgi:hypothetical protein
MSQKTFETILIVFGVGAVIFYIGYEIFDFKKQISDFFTL